MTALLRILLAIAFATALGPAGWAQDPSQKKNPGATDPKSVLWARSWESALREAEIRNVPIFVFVSIGKG